MVDKIKMLNSSYKNYNSTNLHISFIPFPKLLIKDHKKINENGEFPTRLVIPAKNFTATFSKISYLGIKRCPDKGKVNYSRNSIVQASDLKETLEETGLK